MSKPDVQSSIRRRVIYTGHVQGVSFRATCVELARDFRVVGHVRNQPDGSVEVEAEGAPGEIDQLLSAIANHFAGNIRHAEESAIPLISHETRFQIRF